LPLLSEASIENSLQGSRGGGNVGKNVVGGAYGAKAVGGSGGPIFLDPTRNGGTTPAAAAPGGEGV